MDTKEIELVTPLAPADCVSRLHAAIDADWSTFFGMFGSRPVMGRVTQSSLSLRKRIGYRNSFQSHLLATMRPAKNGTVICGRIGMAPFVRIFMFIWFGGVVLVGGVIFIAALSQVLFDAGRRGQNAWLGVLAPLVMLAFGIGLVRIGRYLARDEARFLREFLKETLEARELPREMTQLD